MPARSFLSAPTRPALHDLGSTEPRRGDQHATSLIPEWKYYKDGKAWLCKVIKGKKTIVWMSAWKNYIKATIYLPEKHINGVLVLDIHEITKKAFIETNNIGRSRPCMFELKEENILEDFIKVMQFKMTLK
ncbi:DUF3788 family protein [Aeromonas dhakensis]|uniref:DUF3788 family protein n=1 Tax=Aeromonas dhakensis TaxID=196024 RepID=UPI002041CC96|nr:DUF3788 family protein [Aeromonas dhakensis]